MRLVLVEWLDSFGCSRHWEPLEGAATASPQTCKSVGWLAHDGDDCKVVIPHLAEAADPPQGCGDMTIPTQAIVRLVDLSESVPA